MWLLAGAPPTWSFEGQGESSPDWTFVRIRLNEIEHGDKVIPFLLRWRIGSVGTVREVRANDADWNPTVDKGNYSGSDESELGRRLLVTWEEAALPPGGMVATVPAAKRSAGRSPLATHRIEGFTAEQFRDLCLVLSTKDNWGEITATLEPLAPPPALAVHRNSPTLCRGSAFEHLFDIRKGTWIVGLS